MINLTPYLSQKASLRLFYVASFNSLDVLKYLMFFDKHLSGFIFNKVDLQQCAKDSTDRNDNFFLFVEG